MRQISNSSIHLDIHTLSSACYCYIAIQPHSPTPTARYKINSSSQPATIPISHEIDEFVKGIPIRGVGAVSWRPGRRANCKMYTTKLKLAKGTRFAQTLQLWAIPFASGMQLKRSCHHPPMNIQDTVVISCLTDTTTTAQPK